MYILIFFGLKPGVRRIACLRSINLCLKTLMYVIIMATDLRALMVRLSLLKLVFLKLELLYIVIFILLLGPIVLLIVWSLGT
jgi:hypothetical protein